MHETTDNYLALAVSVLANCPPERAFDLLETGDPTSYRFDITDEDVQDMIKLKMMGLTWKQLGEIYCMDKNAVYGRIRHLGGGSVKNIIKGAGA